MAVFKVVMSLGLTGLLVLGIASASPAPLHRDSGLVARQQSQASYPSTTLPVIIGVVSNQTESGGIVAPTFTASTSASTSALTSLSTSVSTSASTSEQSQASYASITPPVITTVVSSQTESGGIVTPAFTASTSALSSASDNIDVDPIPGMGFILTHTPSPTITSGPANDLYGTPTNNLHALNDLTITLSTDFNMADNNAKDAVFAPDASSMSASTKYGSGVSTSAWAPGSGNSSTPSPGSTTAPTPAGTGIALSNAASRSSYIASSGHYSNTSATSAVVPIGTGATPSGSISASMPRSSPDSPLYYVFSGPNGPRDPLNRSLWSTFTATPSVSTSSSVPPFPVSSDSVAYANSSVGPHGTGTSWTIPWTSSETLASSAGPDLGASESSIPAVTTSPADAPAATVGAGSGIINNAYDANQCAYDCQVHLLNLTTTDSTISPLEAINKTCDPQASDYRGALLHCSSCWDYCKIPT
ncbi:hypothetical protein NA57DRAFT_58273 [Rhizodiscina lignyota]|uniref:Uncharacterized protein n=1 Tax=Rhizodiscina lignyota TaxID=1504668 RepID=A0A9P4M351_9PEZI|nr:hypothetical protein NA57DRAFT_58273 [Rhizodiscina lignyota]